MLARLDLKKSTLATWVRKHRGNDPFWVPTPRERTQPPARCKVGDVRTVLRMVDEGMTHTQIRQETGHDRQTLRRWRDDPRYREATMEYDPAFRYDYSDLMDRATVAQHLCTETPHVGERFDLLMAAVGAPSEHDEFSIPYGKQSRRKGWR